MGIRKCELKSCKKKIKKDNEYSVKVPEPFCHYCKSERFAEYYFCSKECAIKWLQKDN